MKKSLLAICLTAVICLTALLVSCVKKPADEGEALPLLTEVLNNLASVNRYYDGIAEQYKSALEEVSAFANAGGTDTAPILLSLDSVISFLDEAPLPDNTLKRRGSQFSGESLSYIDFQTAFNVLPVIREEYKNTLRMLTWYLTEYTLYDRDEILSTVVEIELMYLENEIRLQYIALNLFLINVDEDTAINFRDTQLLTLPSYQREALPWQWSESVLEEWSAIAEENIKAALERYDVLIGEQQSDIDNTAAALNRLNEEEAELQKLRDQLAEARQAAREKFMPKPTDALDLLWGKAVRFNTMNDDEYVDLCFDMFIQKAQTDGDDGIDEKAAEKIAAAAIAFWAEVRGGKYEGGIQVLALDSPEGHEFLQIADIIIEVNGATCNGFDDYRNNRNADASNEIVYLRLEGDELVRHESTASADSSASFSGGNLIEFFD